MKESEWNENKGYVKPSEANTMPVTPGVYLMKNAAGEVIYVGKAKVLKKRVSSYFHKKHSDEKTRQLVANVALIDYISVPTEAEALFLEANLIKKYDPRYNVVFKDNKFYPFIKVTLAEKYPRILLARQTPKDGSVYFGPYMSAKSVRRYIDVVKRLFQLRVCGELPKKECLNYHIHRCSAPCIGKIGEAEYAEQVQNALRFLRGETDELVAGMERQMREASAALEFERAQAFKDKIDAIRFFEMSQSVYLKSRIDADFVSAAADMGKAVFVVLLIRQGKLSGKRSFTASLAFGEELEDVVERFVAETYPAAAGGKPLKVVLGEEYAGIAATLDEYFGRIAKGQVPLSGEGTQALLPEDVGREMTHIPFGVPQTEAECAAPSAPQAQSKGVTLSAPQTESKGVTLSAPQAQSKGARVAVSTPSDEEEKTLVGIASENAALHLSQVVSRVDVSESLGQLQEALGLDRLPMRIEGFDIANLLGEQAVASMVSFYAAKPDKKNYRRFRIRGKDTPDDFAMMRETVYRRYKRLSESGEAMPDLVLIDGGKGQLNAALDALKAAGVELNVASLAKRNEELYRPGKPEPVVLPKNSPALHVVQRVRDESHRFANSYYNKLKGRKNLESVLDGIEGIGEKRKKLILDTFLKPEVIDSLTVGELVEAGIPERSAEKVYIRLKNWYNEGPKKG